jgi:probable rRNA maturation factor
MSKVIMQSVQLFGPSRIPLTQAEVECLAHAIFKKRLHYDIVIYMQNDVAIRRLKYRYFGLRQSTDVISLDYSTTKNLLEGEIHIGMPAARRQAKEYGVELKIELLRLIAHGLLHLSGYDDNTEKRRLAMSRLEDRALKAFKKK